MTRDEAIKEFVGYQTYDIQPSVEATKMAIEALKVGRWIKETMPIPLSDTGKECVRCSECNLHYDVVSVYCPNCGAKMESEVE